MFYPGISFSRLAESVILFTASTFTFNTLYQGSKSNFGYILIAFTFLYGFSCLSFFIMFLFPNDKFYQLPHFKKLPNGYAWLTNEYLYNLLSLQSWIFGLNYLQSGILCSHEATCISVDFLKCIGWAGGLCFTAIMIISWCILMTTFPGLAH